MLLRKNNLSPPLDKFLITPLNTILWKRWQDLRKKFSAKFYINQLRVMRKIRALLLARGPKAHKLFWNLEVGNNKRKIWIDIQEDNSLYRNKKTKSIVV